MLATVTAAAAAAAIAVAAAATATTTCLSICFVFFSRFRVYSSLFFGRVVLSLFLLWYHPFLLLVLSLHSFLFPVLRLLNTTKLNLESRNKITPLLLIRDKGPPSRQRLMCLSLSPYVVVVLLVLLLTKL